MAGQFARTVSCATYLTKPSCELPRIWSISWIVSMGALQCGAVAVSSRLAERSRRRTRDWRGHGRAAGDPGRASSTGTGVCRAHRRSDHRARHRQDTLTFRTPSDCLLPHLAIPTRLLSSCNESAWRSEHSGYDSTAEIRAHSLSVMSVLKLICCLQGLSAGRAAHPWTAPHHSRPLEAGRSACLLVAAADFLTTAVAPASPARTTISLNPPRSTTTDARKDEHMALNQKQNVTALNQKKNVIRQQQHMTLSRTFADCPPLLPLLPLVSCGPVRAKVVVAGGERSLSTPAEPCLADLARSCAIRNRVSFSFGCDVPGALMTRVWACLHFASASWFTWDVL
mmetsp:Transcript_50589/g.101007  ORF Transcript_50589/g.101007 Transcript_50589/m.101007 type:complete len:340 (+) Transcript_50589:331-1350(+)